MLKLFIGASAALGLVFLLLAVALLKRAHPVRGTLHLLAGGCFLSAAIAAGFLGTSLLTYERLTHEQPALDLDFAALGDRHYRVTMREPSGRTSAVDLRGQEWQLDARILKWKGLATVLGFDTIYRLERIGGRYRDVTDERTAPRTVHALHPPDRIDTWDLVRRAQEWLPFIDARYGTAVYLPMADGAKYQASVSASGLVARPVNAKAKEAVGGWR